MSDGIVLAGFTMRARRPDGTAFDIGPLTISLAPGERVLIVGASGSGKSLLLATLAGLRPHAIVAGTASLARPLGVVSARDGLLLDRTALDNVLTAAIAAGGVDAPRQGALAHCLDVLQQLGVADCAHRLPAALSGGQRRRIALARALVVGAGSLLLDDPTAGLDPDTAAEVLDVAARMAPAAAVIVACQDPDVVGPWATRAIALSIVGDGVSATVMPVSLLPAPFAPRPFPSFLGAAVLPAPVSL